MNTQSDRTLTISLPQKDEQTSFKEVKNKAVSKGMTDSSERRKQKEYSEERETAICSPEDGSSRKQNISFEKEEWKGSLGQGGSVIKEMNVLREAFFCCWLVSNSCLTLL